MKQILTIATATMLIAGVASGASAEKAHKHSHRGAVTSQEGMTTGEARSGSYSGGNAALSGNNGNSGQGSNSLGHIKGGDIGAGK